MTEMIVGKMLNLLLHVIGVFLLLRFLLGLSVFFSLLCFVIVGCRLCVVCFLLDSNNSLSPMLQTSEFVKVRGSGKFEVYFLAASAEVCAGFKYDSTTVLITFSVPVP